MVARRSADTGDFGYIWSQKVTTKSRNPLFLSFINNRTLALLLLVFSCGIPPHFLNGQTPIAVLDFDCGNRRLSLSDFLLGRTYENDGDACQRIQGMAMDALYADRRVQVVVPESLPAVEAERELQKDEDFLAGYVVEQWDQRGAEFLLTGQVAPGRQELVLEIHRLSDRQVVASQVQSFKVGYMAPTEAQRTLVEQGLQLLLTDFFRAKIPVVKVLNGASKARRVLVAGGESQGFRLHQELRVLIQGEAVGTVVVEAVEGEFFSRCRVISGGRAISTALAEGQEVEVEILKL